MKKKIIVELSGAWVLKHKDDEVLPTKRAAESLKKEGFKLEDEGLISFVVVCDDTVNTADLQNKIESSLAAVYPSEDLKGVVTLSEEETAAAISEADGDEDGNPVFSSLFDGDEDDEPAEAIDRDQAEKDKIAEIVAKIDALVGVGEIKELFKEIVTVAPQIVKKNTQDVFAHQSYLVSIGDGCGYSTYLSLFAELVDKLGLRDIYKSSPVIEETLGPVKEDMSSFSDAIRALQRGTPAMVRIVSIDISEWLNATDSRFFKQFLKTAESCAAYSVIFFRIPFVEKNVLEKIRFSLNDVLYIRALSCPPFTRAELQQCAQAELSKYGFTISNAAWDFFHERLVEEKSDGKFYGLNTVAKVVRELVYKKQLDNAKKGKDDVKIGKADTQALIFTPQSGLTGAEMLAKLVGNESVKNKINEILAQIELALKNPGLERPCIHMRFVGNPGTGKTTVARIIGKILKERGVLRIGNFFECAGRDLCGRYIGETAPKTASMCRDAYGSVLFIDEAYSLFRGDNNDRDYGREAIDTLIAEMENHRSDFVVIMAGYTDDMEKLMKGNIGLASRMPYTIEFPNFTREQLAEIYVSLLDGNFKYEEEIVPAVKEYFTSLSEEFLTDKEFSNARFVRNLFERTWAKASLRCQLSGQAKIVLTKSDFDQACGEKEFAYTEKKKTRLGF